MPNPQPEAFNQGYLKVSDKHSVWYGEFGNPDGRAVVVLHGGPGGRSKAKHLAMYDLNKQRVIQFDQRGCGLSMPQGEIHENTADDLVADMEKLRKHLNIEKWIVSGGSWGSTLALLYSEAYPSRVEALFLRGVFLARDIDADWLRLETGAARVFPDLWERRDALMAEFGTKPETAAKVFLDKLKHGTDEEKRQITVGVSGWEVNMLALEVDINYESVEDVTQEEMAEVTVFLHYDAHDYFLEKNQILNAVEKIIHIPTMIIHGRYDMVCPLDQAFALHQALPESVLEIPNFDGHKISKESLAMARYMFERLVSQISS